MRYWIFGIFLLVVGCEMTPEQRHAFDLAIEDIGDLSAWWLIAFAIPIIIGWWGDVI